MTEVTPRPAATTTTKFGGRLAAVAAVVFVANAGLLVLQLVAARLLTPFVGSSLETWTAVIAAFLAGIAIGNSYGGRLADRRTGSATLAVWLLAGALAAGWVVALPWVLNATSWHARLPLTPRIPVLAFLTGFPVAFTLSVLTPLGVRIGVPDVSHTGRVAGLVFALSTAGCLVGNYATGFVLIPELTLNQIVIGVAAALGLSAAVVLLIRVGPPDVVEHRLNPVLKRADLTSTPMRLPFAFAAVFLCSFAAMTLELAATRLLAPVVGVSVYTWTGVIGVMLAGIALGNWLGGVIADRRRADRTLTLAWCMITGSLLSVGVILLFGVLSARGWFTDLELVPRVLAWTFALFFLPSLALGTVSPQVIRMAVPDVLAAGRTAGRVYAWSTAGAIAGTFATGYVLISTMGVLATILTAAALPAGAVLLVAGVRRTAVLYGLCVAGGALFGGVMVLTTSHTGVTAESNYYTILVRDEWKLTDDREPLAAVTGPAAASRDLRTLGLDLLVHSLVDVNDPTYLKYKHEQFQLEAVYAARDAHPGEQRVLVIGGGGYTFPRCVRTKIPTAAVEVVEIDPAVTRVAYSELALDPKLNITSHHLDGRQFVAERAERGYYHVVTLDAVNDYAVPYHLLTQQCNEAVKATLTADGVYLVTVIDDVAGGKLWKVAYRTLAESFPHVAVTFPKGAFDPQRPGELARSVILLYAASNPLEPKRWAKMMDRQTGGGSGTFVVPEGTLAELLADTPPLILTDQYAPVDNLLMPVFRTRRAEE